MALVSLNTSSKTWWKCGSKSHSHTSTTFQRMLIVYRFQMVHFQNNVSKMRPTEKHRIYHPTMYVSSSSSLSSFLLQVCWSFAFNWRTEDDSDGGLCDRLVDRSLIFLASFISFRVTSLTVGSGVFGITRSRTADERGRRDHNFAGHPGTFASRTLGMDDTSGTIISFAGSTEDNGCFFAFPLVYERMNERMNEWVSEWEKRRNGAT